MSGIKTDLGRIIEPTYSLLSFSRLQQKPVRIRNLDIVKLIEAAKSSEGSEAVHTVVETATASRGRSPLGCVLSSLREGWTTEM